LGAQKLLEMLETEEEAEMSGEKIYVETELIIRRSVSSLKSS
jgi:DNA-binding LacI/PurR family transcriptional regulator